MLKTNFKILLLILLFVSIAQANVQSWGLDRIDQTTWDKDSWSHSYQFNYSGAGTHIYVIDTGINYTHNQFKGVVGKTNIGKSRIGNGIDLIDNDLIANDCHGHGTHVAGIIAGTNYGIAKETIIHPIKVFDCNGHGKRSNLISAIDWILENHIKPAVVNMSLEAINNKIYNNKMGDRR